MAAEINSFLNYTTRKSGINESAYIVDNSNEIANPVNKVIDKFKNHCRLC